MLQTEQEMFSRDGVTVIRGLFKDWVDLLRQGVAINEQQPGPSFRDYTPDHPENRFWADYCNWRRIQPFYEFVYQSPAGQIAKSLMQSQDVRLFHEHVLVKGQNSSKITPWHHDAPYYPVSAKQTLSLWIPLDPISRESSIEFVAGSHRWNKHFKAQSFNGQYYEHLGMQEEPLPDIEGHREQYNILGWELEPGVAFAFVYLTIHGAPGNLSSEHDRRAVSFRWLGDDATYVNRGGKTSPEYPHLNLILKTGDALPTDEFPFIPTL